MRLVEGDEGWHIEGPGSERAHIAYASEEAGRVVLSFDGGEGKSAVSDLSSYPKRSPIETYAMASEQTT